MDTTWPADVVARYLTTGGATVDITQRPRYINTDQLLDGIATCTGCHAARRFDGVDDDCWGGHDHALTVNTSEASVWAQTRAMPKPTTDS